MGDALRRVGNLWRCVVFACYGLIHGKSDQTHHLRWRPSPRSKRFVDKSVVILENTEGGKLLAINNFPPSVFFIQYLTPWKSTNFCPCSDNLAFFLCNYIKIRVTQLLKLYINFVLVSKKTHTIQQTTLNNAPNQSCRQSPIPASFRCFTLFRISFSLR
jgi:hypothetical protein